MTLWLSPPSYHSQIGNPGLEIWKVVALEDLQANAAVRGILSDGLVTVVSVQWFGSEALELTYKTPTGTVANELVYRHDEPKLEIVEVGRPWSFDGDGALFRLVSEAQRIHLAHLFDPVLAVHTSVVEPLPWGAEVVKRRPDITTEMADQFLTKMFRDNPDFVFTVTRDFVKGCQTPVLVLPDDTSGPSLAVAIESAMLAPNGQLSMYPWKDTPEKIPLAVRHVRSFLLSYRPT